MSSVTGMCAIVWSLLSSELLPLLSGFTALITCGALFSDVTASSTACLYFESVSLPDGACTTIGLLP